jgi:Glycosyltransferase family 87
VGLIWLSRIAAAVLLALLVLLAREAATRSIDFPVYHRAARQVLAGNYELYPPEAYGGRPFPSQGFRYAPAVAVLFVPFGWLPLELAALVFFALKLAALWYVGATVARHVGLSGRRRQVLLVAFLVVGGYVVEELRFGNAHFFCITLMVFAYDRAESGHVLMPAVALAVATAMKITPLALLAYFAIRRRWFLCLSTIAVLCLLVVLPGAVIGSAQNARQLRAFATYAMEKIEEDDNYSLRGALVRYLTPGHADISHVDASVAHLSSTAVNGIWLLGLVGLGLAALAALWREVDDRVVRLLEFSIVLTGIVLASPHTQRRYFVALYVPAVALVALLARTPPADQKRLMRLVFGGRRLALLYEASSPYFFGALVLFGALVMLTVRRKAGHVDTAHVRDEYVNPIALPMMGDQ